MKCPACGEWVDYFNYSTPATEYGTVNEDGEFDSSDTDYGDTTITCPECGDEVFGSSWRTLEEYYERDREKGIRR